MDYSELKEARYKLYIKNEIKNKNQKKKNKSNK